MLNKYQKPLPFIERFIGVRGVGFNLLAATFLIGLARGIGLHLYLAVLPRWLTGALFHNLLRILETLADV